MKRFLCSLLLCMFLISCGGQPSEAATKAESVQFLLSQVRNSTGSLAGGTVTFYAAGTTTLKTIWLDRNKATPAANPYTLDSNGTAQLYADGLYKILIKNSAGVTVYTRDNIGFSLTDGPWIDVSEYASLTAAVTAIGSTTTDLLIDSATTLTGNTTVPANIRLMITSKGSINQSTHTLTINSPFTAGNYQVFTGSGAVTGLKEARPEWWGAKPDGTTDSTIAINAAIASLSEGGRVLLQPGTYMATQINLRRFVTIVGAGMGNTELKQIAGTNADFVVSENFAALTGTGKTVAVDSTVPSFYGLSKLRVNGNRTGGNTSGRGIAWYGPAITIDDVIVYNCADNGVYTEYSATAGSSSWQGQEEGRVSYLISRDNAGIGWLNRGPHNTSIGTYLAGYNKSWGYYSEVAANYDGNVTEIEQIHTYANARPIEWPTLDVADQDRGSYIGAVSAINHLVVDGDYAVIAAPNTRIDRIKLLNGGQTHDGVAVTGAYVNIGEMHGNMIAAASSIDGEKWALRIAASGVTAGTVKLFSASGYHKGALLDGNSGNASAQVIRSLYARDFSLGCSLTAGLSEINGTLLNNTTGFNYTYPTGTHLGKNRVCLDIYQTSGDYVTGDTPKSWATGHRDDFRIRATGQGNKSTEIQIETAQVALDSTAAQSVTVAHGLLYTPTKAYCTVSLQESSPADTAPQFAYIRIGAIDATNITIQFRLLGAGGAGTKGRFGVTCKN